MSSTVAPKIVDPPFYDPPIVDNPAAGQQHSQAWTEYHQSVADQVNALAAAATANTGVVDGSDATAGQIGEYVTTSASIGLTSAAYANVAVMSLPAGDWDVSGNVQFTASGATGNSVIASISTVSNTASGVLQQFTGSFPASFIIVIDTGSAGRISAAAATDVYLVARAVFSGGSVTAAGSIRARRMR